MTRSLPMLALVTLVAALPVAASGQAVGKGAAVDRSHQKCATASARQVDGKPQVAGPRKLGEMPPAKQYLTVLREVDGCPKPVVLREGIGR